MTSAAPSEDRLIVMGTIAGAHGVRGDVRVKSFTEDPEDVFAYGPLLSDKGEPLLEAKSVRAGKDHFIVTPKTPRQKEEWDAMKGVRLHVLRSRLPAPDDDEFYIEDLVGLRVLNEQAEIIGSVKSVQDFGAGDLLEVLPSAKGSPAFFVPFTLADVPEVHFDPGHVVIRNAHEWADQSTPPSGDQG